MTACLFLAAATRALSEAKVDAADSSALRQRQCPLPALHPVTLFRRSTLASSLPVLPQVDLGISFLVNLGSRRCWDKLLLGFQIHKGIPKIVLGCVHLMDHQPRSMIGFPLWRLHRTITGLTCIAGQPCVVDGVPWVELIAVERTGPLPHNPQSYPRSPLHSGCNFPRDLLSRMDRSRSCHTARYRSSRSWFPSITTSSRLAP